MCVGDKATYLGMWVEAVGDSDFEGLISDSDNYGGKLTKLKFHAGERIGEPML